MTVLWSCEGTASPHLEIWWAPAKPSDVLVLDPPWWQETLPVFPRLHPLRHSQSPWSLDAGLTCCVSLYFLGRTVNLLFQLRLGLLRSEGTECNLDSFVFSDFKKLDAP